MLKRFRIKALAAVPVRKKPTQNSVDSTEADNEADKEKKKETVSNISETKQKVTKDITQIEQQKEEAIVKTDTSEQKQQKEDISSTNISEEEKEKEKDNPSTDSSKREAVKDIAKVQEKIKEKRDEVSLRESVIVEKPNSQELCSQLKLKAQELHVQARPNSQEPPAGLKSGKVTDQLIQKSIPLPDVPTIIEIASPTKVIQSRPCFMRPTPRLDSGGRIRKNSIQGSGASASESEDEHSKRVASVVPSRVRNDSVCSVQSNKETAVNDNQNSPLKIKTMQKRRTLVSESARKLAEARREFLLKHENKTPDRSQLKMYDLIYYNPVTNPMKKLSAGRRVEPLTMPQPVEIPEEEDEDDPSAMPTPQVKVGPDGQLIIDEQSLVIEQTDARRDEELLASEVTIEDENSHSGGFYKRHKRSKEWPKWETFKFYRVLNVVGTDFLLMQTLFPNRSRQEIKQKYKKEERVNRQLVEKALKYHQEFDTDMLEEQLAMIQNLENTCKKPLEKIKSKQSLSRMQRKRKHRLVAESIGECGPLPNDQEVEDTVVSTTNDEIDIEISSDTNNAQQQMGKRKARKLKKRSDDKSEKFDDSSCTADSDSSEEIYQLRPTRSGRLPKKIKKLGAPNLNILNSDRMSESPIDKSVIPSHVAVEVTEYVNTSVTNSENTESSCSDNIVAMIPNINQMEPGALVIVSKESTENPGNTILQVYMVASNIDSSTTVTSSVASGNQSLEPLTNQSDSAESINIVDESEK